MQNLDSGFHYALRVLNTEIERDAYSSGISLNLIEELLPGDIVCGPAQ
jgi:hypothetical protein